MGRFQQSIGTFSGTGRRYQRRRGSCLTLDRRRHWRREGRQMTKPSLSLDRTGSGVGRAGRGRSRSRSARSAAAGCAGSTRRSPAICSGRCSRSSAPSTATACGCSARRPRASTGAAGRPSAAAACAAWRSSSDSLSTNLAGQTFIRAPLDVALDRSSARLLGLRAGRARHLPARLRLAALRVGRPGPGPLSGLRRPCRRRSRFDARQRASAG